MIYTILVTYPLCYSIDLFHRNSGDNKSFCIINVQYSSIYNKTITHVR